MDKNFTETEQIKRFTATAQHCSMCGEYMGHYHSEEILCDLCEEEVGGEEELDLDYDYFC